MPLFAGPICVLDTETSGLLNEPRAQVVELGAVILSAEGELVATFSSLVRQRDLGPWAEPAFAVNCLDPAILETAPHPIGVWATFCTWWNMHEQPKLTSYKVSFDRPFLLRSFGRWIEHEGPPEVYYLPLLEPQWTRCIKKQTEAHFGRRTRLSEAGAILCGEVEEQSHRALDDAMLAARVLVRLAELNLENS